MKIEQKPDRKTRRGCLREQSRRNIYRKLQADFRTWVFDGAGKGTPPLGGRHTGIYRQDLWHSQSL